MAMIGFVKFPGVSLGDTHLQEKGMSGSMKFGSF